MQKTFHYPTIETNRLFLKILTIHDAAHLFQHFSDEEVTRFMDIEICKSVEEAKDLIVSHEEDLGCRWGIYTKEESVFIGTCGFHYIRESNGSLSAEIGYDLSKTFWGNGYMIEAVKAMNEFGFKEMGLSLIDATVEPNNEKSIKLLEKLGFTKEEEIKDGLLYFTKKGER
ncbi:ribosomal-protein-alanine N-acetyltransferase [Salirhabdus euzebyi]|uniref:Ribosomal-protein-alanine N-acetyltransferase n=1 Tax=Salirhabdus euzebyi TaxID=394506 RepID=A0A841Q4C2_9BACI|nr:GNAT family N-acetyltransferase [Salirhabdus euzebyi]MBB6453180.1 ribosomal-protein-alanine N-acetyltransferase [Salirhabdus euzebyi]